jgi:DNA polymerase-3 subunit epsilon
VPLNFTAIDFETANNSPASPCAVGLVRVRDGKVDDSFALAFMPPSPHGWFSEFTDGPTWAEVLPLMLEFIGEDVLIAHNAPFDMGVLRAAASAVNTQLPELHYACTVQMSRRAFPGLDSHRLNEVAYRIGFEDFKHHDALDDARACAEIVIYIARRDGLGDLHEVLETTRQTLKPLHKPVTE